MTTEITIDELMGLNIDLQKELEASNRTVENYKISNKAIIEELSEAKSLSHHNSEAMRITINLKDLKIKGLEQENTELKRRITLFIDAEQWGKDAAKYEGEYQ